MGSNPILSAIADKQAFLLYQIDNLTYGEVPKRPKGLPC